MSTAVLSSQPYDLLVSENDCQRPTWCLVCVSRPNRCHTKVFSWMSQLLLPTVSFRCERKMPRSLLIWLPVTAVGTTWSLICHRAKDSVWCPDLPRISWLLCLPKYSEKSLCIHGLFTPILLLSPSLFNFQMTFGLQCLIVMLPSRDTVWGIVFHWMPLCHLYLRLFFVTFLTSP